MKSRFKLWRESSFAALFSWSSWIDVSLFIQDDYYCILQCRINSLTNSKRFRLKEVCPVASFKNEEDANRQLVGLGIFNCKKLFPFEMTSSEIFITLNKEELCTIK